MLAGVPYDPTDPELVAARARARRLTQRYAVTADEELELRRALLDELLGSAGEGLWIEPPFFCDYGEHIAIGPRTFLNFNCVILDCAAVTIGADVLIGPAVQIYAATHPLDTEERRAKVELARPVTVGDNVWLGGGAIVCPGVTIGENTVVGAGSVVTRDLPANVVAVGNPCRVVRPL